jgi:hypothetical protein
MQVSCNSPLTLRPPASSYDSGVGEGTDADGQQTQLIRDQLRLALEIVDNPGGGLVFGYQALGQARAQLGELDEHRWREVIRLLDGAERQAVWRNFSQSRELIVQALAAMGNS